MFKKKNKNLHRALIALMVLGLLVCLCFTLASAATAEPDSSSAAETTAAEEQGAQSNTEAMTNFLNQAGIATLIHNADWKSIVMILISFVLMYLAIGKGFEPLLLLPIAFGMLLTNLPGAGMFHSEIFEGGHIHWDLIKNGVTLSNGANEAAGLIDILYLGVKLGIYPCLIFIGVGAMTDFGPLIANPKSLLLGAAAQLGIFIAYLGALGLSKLGIPGLEFTQKMAASIGIIGGADGPTAIYVTSRLASELLGHCRLFLHGARPGHPAAHHARPDHEEGAHDPHGRPAYGFQEGKDRFPDCRHRVRRSARSERSSAGRQPDARQPVP